MKTTATMTVNFENGDCLETTQSSDDEFEALELCENWLEAELDRDLDFSLDIETWRVETDKFELIIIDNLAGDPVGRGTVRMEEEA